MKKENDVKKNVVDGYFLCRHSKPPQYLASGAPQSWYAGSCNRDLESRRCRFKNKVSPRKVVIRGLRIFSYARKHLSDKKIGRCRIAAFRHDRPLCNAAFTLIELLVVVLIIGILAAVALPQYQKVVLKTRLMQYIQYVSAIQKSNMLYYMENGKYANDVRDLDIDITQTAVEFKQASWTGLEFIAAYFKNGNNTNCGPGVNGTGVCLVYFSSSARFYLVAYQQNKIKCGGYSALADSVCRSLAGGKPGHAWDGHDYDIYEVRF